jgi:hypothetical protein
LPRSWAQIVWVPPIPNVTTSIKRIDIDIGDNY